MANRFLSNIKINDAYTFPASDGTNGQVIKTDGSGNLSFAQLAADSASVMYKDTFTGNGSTTAFTLANALNDEVQSNIYIDGVYQSKSTYSVSGTTVTFSTAPASGHEIEVISTTGINSGPTAIYTDTFTANGSATAFTLGQTVHNENQTIVFLNGVYQFKGTYTLSGTTLTLDTAPANGVAIEVMSIGSAYSGGDILYDHDFASAGLMTTNGSGVYSITANNSANWNTAYGWGDHSTQSYATQSYVGTQIANLVDSSPSTLNTLNELAAALGDDPNFATTTANSIGTKMPLAGGTFTGNVSLIASSAINLRVTDGTQNIYVGSSGNTRFGLGAGASIIQSTGASFGVGTQDGNSLILGTNNTAALTINSSQNATFAGTINGSGVELSNYMQIKVDDAEIYWTNTANNDYWRWRRDASNNFICDHYNGSSTTAALTFNSSQNATFAGDVTIGGKTYPKLNLTDSQGVARNFSVGTNNETFTVRNETAGSDAFTISNGNNATFAGNVQLGGTTPTLNFYKTSHADILANIKVESDTGTGGKLTIQTKRNGNTALDALVIYENQNSTFTGNVGIGTTSPNAQLEISNPNATSGAGGATLRLTRVDSTSVAGDPVGTIEFYSTDADTPKTTAYIKSMSEELYGRQGSLAFGVSQSINANATEAMRINSSGEVGIGTTSPSQPLHVVGNIKTFGHIFLQSNANGFRTVALDTTDGADNQELYLCGGGTASSSRGGQVGVYGNEVSGTGGSVVIVAGNVSTGDIDFLTANTQRMIINNAGNVGIGTTSPLATLDLGNNAGQKFYVYANGGVRSGMGIDLSGSSRELSIFHTSSNNIDGDISLGLRNETSGQYVERMRVQGNGNVGIGTTSPFANATANQGLNIDRGGHSSLLIGDGINDGGMIQASDNSQRIFIGANMYDSPTASWASWVTTTGGTGIDVANWGMRVNTRSSGAGFGIVRFFISSTGTVNIRNTSNDAPSASSLVGSGFKYDSKDRATLCQASNSTNLTDLQEYFNPNGAVGKIQTSGSSTLFTTSSDYRLKEDLKSFNGLDMISNITVYDFKWKISNERGYGVMAHELQQILPQAVGGDKDYEKYALLKHAEYDQERNLIKEAEYGTRPSYQTVDYSKIVPLLVKSIQELKADNDSLKARIETLENN